MKHAVLLVLLGCGSSASKEPPSPSPTPTPTPTASDAAVPSVTRKPKPAGDGVEILVANTEGANDLVVTDEYLYWIGGGDFKNADVQRARHEVNATASMLFDAPDGADVLVRARDRLVWQEPAWFLSTLSLPDGKPVELIKIPDAAWQMADHDGLVVSAYMPGSDGDARIFRVSDSGEVSELVSLPKIQGADFSFDPKGDLYVATNTTGSFGGRRELGRVVDGTFVPIMKFANADGPKVITTDADAVYYVSDEEESFIDKIYRLPTGAKKPQLLARGDGSITALAVDDRYVYWGDYVDNGKIWRMPKKGGKPAAIADCGSTTGFVIYGPDLYWADSRLNHIARIRR